MRTTAISLARSTLLPSVCFAVALPRIESANEASTCDAFEASTAIGIGEPSVRTPCSEWCANLTTARREEGRRRRTRRCRRRRGGGSTARRGGMETAAARPATPGHQEGAAVGIATARRGRVGSAAARRDRARRNEVPRRALLRDRRARVTVAPRGEALRERDVRRVHKVLDARASANDTEARGGRGRDTHRHTPSVRRASNGAPGGGWARGRAGGLASVRVSATLRGRLGTSASPQTIRPWNHAAVSARPRCPSNGIKQSRDAKGSARRPRGHATRSEQPRQTAHATKQNGSTTHGRLVDTHHHHLDQHVERVRQLARVEELAPRRVVREDVGVERRRPDRARRALAARGLAEAATDLLAGARRTLSRRRRREEL